MLSRAEFLKRVQETFGGNVAVDAKLTPRQVLYEAVVGIVTGDETIQLQSKMVMAKFVANEIRQSDRKLYLCTDGSAVAIVVGARRRPSPAYFVPPLAWAFSLDDPLHLEMEVQLSLAQMLSTTEFFDDDGWCLLARDVIYMLYQWATHMDTYPGEIDIEAAKYILRTWAPRHITVTHDEIILRRRSLAQESATLHELESLLYGL